MFKESAFANLVLSFAPIVTGFVITFLIMGALSNPGKYAWAALACYGIGFVLFATAKIKNIRKGHFVSFGSALMLPAEKWAYRIGYALMVFGFFITVAVLVASKYKV
jgi:hypothetical protein